MTSHADAYIASADTTLHRLGYGDDAAAIYVAEAQVHATKAVAAALDRLAAALENLQVTIGR